MATSQALDSAQWIDLRRYAPFEDVAIDIKEPKRIRAQAANGPGLAFTVRQVPGVV